MENQLCIENLDDMTVRDAIMDKYGDSSPEPFYGKNDNGELIRIDVFNNRIILETMQDNGWIRKNFYYRGEEMAEEVFSGKWRSKWL